MGVYENVMIIGVICALHEELDEIKKLMFDVKKIKIGNFEFITGIINNIKCVLILCGVGKVHAAISCQNLITNFNPDLILNIGVVGALDKKINIGDIILATSTIQYDFDVSVFPNRKKGEISGLSKVEFECTSWVLDKLINISKNINTLNFHTGIVLTGDKFISNKQEKIKLNQEFGGIVCDMEACSIAQTCYVNSKNFGIIKSVSDSLNNNSIIEFKEFINISSKNSALIFENFVKEVKF